MLFEDSKPYDLIVVGGGILGAFHAYFALQNGYRVLLLEKDAQPMEATVRNFGQIVPSGMSEDEWFEYGRVTTATYLAIQQQYDISIRANGATYLASTAGEWQVLEEKHARYRQLGYDSELLTPLQCQQRIKALKSDYCHGGLYFPQEVTAEPALLIHQLLRYLVTHLGLDYRPATPIIRCTVEQGICQVTDVYGGAYRAAQVVVCSGRDTQFLFPEVFIQSDLQLCKLQMLETCPLPQVFLPGSILTGLSIRRYEAFRSCAAYAQLNPVEVPTDLQQWGIHLLFKQAVDGRIIIGDSHEYVALKDTNQVLDFGNQDLINTLILTEAQRILDLPDWRIKRTWNGYYTQSATRKIFEHTLDDKIHVVTGIGGKGMTTACGFAQQNIKKLGYTKKLTTTRL